MILPLLRRSEFAVGGDRMEMSRAVPRRRGTKGVSSIATKGLTPCVDGLTPVASLNWPATACACAKSNASISPGVTTISHSSGCMLSHEPLSFQERIQATDLAAPFVLGGTARYGAWDGESEGRRDSWSKDCIGFGEGAFAGRRGAGLLKSFSSPSVDIASSTVE